MSDVADIPEVIGSVDVVQPASETAEPEIPKQRIKRPTRPDDAAHKQKVEALQDISTLLRRVTGSANKSSSFIKQC